MKRTLLLLAVASLCACPVACAGGLNLTWGTLCYTEYPVTEKTFACNTNATTSAYQWPMTMSFMIDTEMTDFVGVEITLMGMSSFAALPDWWKIGDSPDCRAGALTYDADNSADVTETCLDWTAGQAFSVVGYDWELNRAYISAGAAIPANQPYDLLPGQEYYAGTLVLRNGKTVGTDACTGCSYGMVWGLATLVVAGLDGRRDLLDYPLPGGNGCLSWNHGNFWACYPGDPVHTTTWGQVKSLYR